jgi:hypothetical protein
MDLIKEIQKLENEINEKLKANNVLVRILEDGDKNKGTIMILKDEKIDRNFKIEAISCCQINIYSNEKEIENGLFTSDLGKWLYNLYNQIEFLYVFYGGKLKGEVLTREQINEISNGNTKDLHKEREKGLLVHRRELDNQPEVKGYLGPMFEKIGYGKIYLRYETKEVYDMLSN